jgi:hypothetical protein
MMAGKINKYIFTFLLTGLFGSSVFGEVYLRASVDKDSVSINDSLVLSVEVSGSETGIEKPKLPSLPNFNIYSSGRTQNVSIINGKVSSSISYKYTLAPRFTGKATIGAITLTHKGKTYSTSPIEVTVVSAGNPPPTSKNKTYTKSPVSVRTKSQGRDVFISAWVDKKSAFVSQQITLTTRFYTSVALLGNPQYNAPTLDNFISEDLPPYNNGIENIKGKDYHYIEIKTALFGVTAGNAKINPAEVIYRTRNNANIDPFADDFISQFFSQGAATSQAQSVRTNPITVLIKPLPEKNQPKNFTGAVGKYEIKAFLDKPSLKAGEFVNLTVKIFGFGNLKTVTDPKLTLSNDFYVYDTVTSLNIEKKNNIVSGSKVFKTVISPKKAGSFVIAPIRFVYFDTKSKKYEEISTKVLKLEVLPSDEKDSVKYTFSSSSGKQIDTLTEDINYIKENANRYKAGFLVKINSLGNINLISIFIFIFGLAVYFIRKFYFNNTDVIRHKRAYALAYNSIRKAKKIAGKNKFEQLVDFVSDILNDYLCSKTKCIRKNITNRELLNVVKKSYPNTHDEITRKIKDFKNKLDMFKFSPVSKKTPAIENQLIDNLKQILKILESGLKK